MGVVREPMAEWELDILKCLADEKPNNVGLTGGQLLEILSRLEQSEQAIARVRAMAEEMGEAIGFDRLVHGQEAEYPVSYFRDKLEEALDGDGRG